MTPGPCTCQLCTALNPSIAQGYTTIVSMTPEAAAELALDPRASMAPPTDTGFDDSDDEEAHVAIYPLGHGYIVVTIDNRELAFSSLDEIGMALPTFFNPPPTATVH